MFGKTVRASIFGFSPFALVDSQMNVTGGIAMELFKVVADYLNFNYEATFAQGRWYNFFPNGTIGGSMGEVSLH